MGSSFYCMILSKIVNVVYIVLSILGLHVTSQKKYKTKEPFEFLSRPASRGFKNISVCMFSSRYRASF